MAKPSCGFSARASVGVPRPAAWAAIVLLSVARLAGAAPAPPQQLQLPYGFQPKPAPVPTLSPEEQAFLALPARDLGFANAGETIWVGDKLKPNVEGKLAKPPKFDSKQESWALIETGEIVPMKPGSVTIPSLEIRDADGKPVARTNPVSIEVKSVIDPKDKDAMQPADVRPPMTLPFPWWFVALVGAAALAGFSGIVYGLVRWSRSRRLTALAPKPVPPPKPEDELALLALAALQAERLIEKGQYKKHYFGVSEILKKYVGARYRFDAAESTSREIVVTLETVKNVGDELVDKVESLFERMDRVKFTDYVPSAEDGSQILEDVRRFVTTTRRPPPVVLETGGLRAV